MDDCVYCDRSIDTDHDIGFVTCETGIHCDDHDCWTCAEDLRTEELIGYTKDEGW